MKRKISLCLTFGIHCHSSPYAQAFYCFFSIRCFVTKRRAKTVGKRETQQNSMPIRIRLRIFLIRHVVTARYCFAHFQKWKSSGLLREDSGEFTQQNGRKKRTAKRLYVTNVTGLLRACFDIIFT